MKWFKLVRKHSLFCLIAVSFTLILINFSSVYLTESPKMTLMNTFHSTNVPIAYLLMAHDTSTLIGVYQLLAVLYDPSHLFVVHMDKKIGIRSKERWSETFKSLSNVHLLNTSLDVRWGSFQIVEMQLDMLSHAVSLHAEYNWEFAVNLCGNTLPIKSNSEIDTFLSSHLGTSFIYEWDQCSHSSNKTDSFCSRGSKKHTTGKSWIKHPQWWILSAEFSQWLILEEHSQDIDQWVKFFMHSSIPDESFFGTLLKYSPFSQQWTKSINTTWVDWEQSPSCGIFYNHRHPFSPCLLDISYFPALSRLPSHYLFARKFPVGNSLRYKVISSITQYSQTVLNILSEHNPDLLEYLVSDGPYAMSLLIKYK